MKKSLRLITAFCFAILINCSSYNVADAQMVYMPDPNLRNELVLQGFGSCIAGDSIDSGCSLILNVNFLYLDSKGISDLTGIAVFSKLYTLLCNNNSLTFLPTLPASLGTLKCENNLLTYLPNSLPSLNELRIGNNYFTTLTGLPASLHLLGCGFNSLYSLPPLPAGLIELTCLNNHLTSLPSLPSTLNALNLESNNFSLLPSLPPSLTYFNCAYNQVTSIPMLPASLNVLYCNNTLIASLPVLPSNLYELYCTNNQLTTLPDLPPLLNTLYCYNNPNLTCLPKLHNMTKLYFYSTAISCIPNYANISGGCNPVLSSLPLCDLFNTNGCTSYWNISGKVYSDTNSNCLAETTEPKLENIKMQLYDSIGNLLQQTISGSEGLYSFDTDTGTYTYSVDTTNLLGIITCPASGFHTSILTAIDSMDFNMDFGLQCKSGFDVGVNAIVRSSGIFRPGFNATVNIKAGDMSNKYGLLCASGISGIVSVVINGDASYVSTPPGSLIPVVNGDTLNYSIADFGKVDFNSGFKIIVQTDTFAAFGNQICLDVNVTPTLGDNDSSNNSLQNCFTVGNSYDPNEKSAYPIDRFEVLNNDKLTYTINFQNTGTAPAQHIYILDTLDAAIDESSFELLAYSNQPQVQIIGNAVRFNFPNINLPDSVNDEPNSHGYVQYRVKLKDSLPQGTVIQNTSYIYFDFNAPVQTNTVVDTVIDCNNLVSIQFTNPHFCNGDTVFANALLGYDSNTDWYVDSVFLSNNQNIAIPNLTIGNHEIKLITSNQYCNVETVSNIQYFNLPVVNLGVDTTTCNIPVVLNSGVNNASYQWSNGKSTKKITAKTSGNYSVIVTDINGCINSDSVNVVKNPLPTIELGNDTTTCNVPVQLDAGQGNSSYEWSSGETTQTIIATATNNYSVIVTDANGCSNADTILITINALPVVTLNAFQNSDTLCVSAGVQIISGGNPPGGTLTGPGVSGNNFNPAQAVLGWNVISYLYTDSNGCANSVTDSVYVDVCLGVISISANEAINIYPNPATDELTISYNFKNASHIKIELYNSMGEKISVLVDKKYQAAGNPQGFKILTGLSKGIYFVKVTEDGKVYAKKLVVE